LRPHLDFLAPLYRHQRHPRRETPSQTYSSRQLRSQKTLSRQLSPRTRRPHRLELFLPPHHPTSHSLPHDHLHYPSSLLAPTPTHPKPPSHYAYWLFVLLAYTSAALSRSRLAAMTP